ncbi:hypothetical protein LCGC14_3091010 [marine sediment metagenome]|uniref:Uncharacterized protein n=1 Tax=marine sediment metagenome TaxID=412755 RepID=A0A0F8WAH9_9ZZZZ
MKIIVIALMVFFLNVTLNIVGLLDIYEFNIAADEVWIQDIESARSEKYDPDVGADVATSFGFGDFITGFRKFRDTIYRVVNVAATLRLFGLDAELSRLFGAVVFALYLLGIAQFISNRSTKGMQ